MIAINFSISVTIINENDLNSPIKGQKFKKDKIVRCIRKKTPTKTIIYKRHNLDLGMHKA